jgi:hypothetical protein
MLVTIFTKVSLYNYLFLPFSLGKSRMKRAMLNYNYVLTFSLT